MPLELTASGLTVKPLSEILDDLEAALKSAYGTDYVYDPDDPVSVAVQILAERLATLHQITESVFASNDPNNATGVALDVIAAKTNTFRKPATKSLSASGLITGVPATVVENGKQVRLVSSQELWNITGGPYVIPGGGTISASIEADETGPKTFGTTGPAGWTIETPVVGWTSFETTADIDPEDTGRNIESDEELRARRIVELAKNGNDLDAIRAAVSALDGVSEVAVFENVDCTTTVDGIPGGAFETMVEGGDDAEIAQAIFDSKPPGAESFGSILTVQLTSEGQAITVGHTRPTDIDVYVSITVGTLGAEAAFPTNGTTLIAEALLEALEQTTQIGKDVIPQAFASVVFDAVKVGGVDSIISATMGMSTSAIGPFLTTPIPITIRERADFDSANISVTVL